MQAKTCTKCGIEKEPHLFYARPEVKTGLSSRCKQCVISASRVDALSNPDGAYERGKRWRLGNSKSATEYAKKYREENKTHIKEICKLWQGVNKDHMVEVNASWRAKNPEKVTSYSAAYRKRNPEKRAESSKKYSDANKAKISAWVKKYRSENREIVNALGAKRRAKKFHATPPWADHAKIKQVYADARFAELNDGIKYHVDHIVPLIHPLVCGLHVHDNLRVITATANRKKSNSFTI